MEGKINNCWSVETKGILSLLDIISGVFQRWLIQNHKSCERFFRSFYSFLRFLPHQPLYRPCCSIGSISFVVSGVRLLGQQHVLYTTLHWLVLWRGQTGISSQRRNNTASSRLPVVSYNAQLAYSEVSGAASNGGRDLHITLDSYRLPQAGQPPASEVLSRHGLPSSLGVWGLGYADKQIVASLPGKKTYLSQRKINKKRTALKLGCSNVHTMTTELDGLPKISDVRTHSSAPMPHPWPPYLRQKTFWGQKKRYHEEHPQQRSPCPPWRLQRQSRCRPWILVFLLVLLWSWQDKRERERRLALCSYHGLCQLLFADEATTQNVMVPPSMQALILARHGHC